VPPARALRSIRSSHLSSFSCSVKDAFFEEISRNVAVAVRGVVDLNKANSLVVGVACTELLTLHEVSEG
jgi:hypothetical protein